LPESALKCFDESQRQLTTVLFGYGTSIPKI
jgi:hypothetical protein